MVKLVFVATRKIYCKDLLFKKDMLEELYSLGKNGNILVLKNGLISTRIYYIGDPETYQLNLENKWHLGKLTYLEQK